MRLWMLTVVFLQYIGTNTGCKPEHYFSCKNGAGIWAGQFCNGIEDCRDGDDEITYNPEKHTAEDGVPCRSLVFPDSTCLLAANKTSLADYVCNSDPACDGTNFICSNNSKCLSDYFYCDGNADCSDGSDEIIYDSSLHSDSGISCHGSSHDCLLPERYVCDGRHHCVDGSDECFCNRNSNGLVFSDKGCFRCLGNTSHIISSTQLCDGIIDCGDLSDECLCTSERSMGLSVCEDVAWGQYEHNECGVNMTAEYRKFCRETFEETHLTVNTTNNTHEYKICRSGKNAVPWSKICDGKADCREGTDEYKCLNKFYCNKTKGGPINIPIEKRCDLRQDCFDASDEVGCENNTYNDCTNDTGTCEYTHFYCNDEDVSFFLDWRKQVCDGNVDCKSAIDECQNCTQGIFSNDDLLISAKQLLPFLWFISGFAVAGNSVVFFRTSVNLWRKFRELSSIAKCHDIIILNLAMADLLVGFYTVAMCILNAIYRRDRYCTVDHAWRSSTSCSMLGVILLIGSETSVFTLCTMTALRLYTIMRPFKRLSVRILCILMSTFWLIVSFLAMIPLLPSTREYFIESIWYSGNSFVTKVEREQVREMSRRMMEMQKLNSTVLAGDGKTGSWSLLESLINNLNPEYIPDRRFGYYSSHGVCLPRLFPDKENDASWGFSLFIIMINFAAFVFILLGYIVIYRKVKKSSIDATSREQRICRLQNKAARIIVTDFCCWVPICIMAFIQLSGKDIPNEVYVPVGMILVPINSALNPLLYSDLPEWMWMKLSLARSWIAAKFEALFAE